MNGLGHPANAAYQSSGTQRKVRTSLLCSAFTHLVLFTTVFLMWVYVFNWANPVAAANVGWRFQWHPVLMVSGFVLFMGEALLAYRLLPFEHQVQKGIHFVLHTLALTAASVGLWCIVTFHDENKIAHFYNIHSILGLTTFVLFGAQYVMGFVSMLFPRLPDAPRAALLPWHKYVGVLVFLCAWFAMLTGLMDRERIVFKDVAGHPAPEFSPPYRLANAAGAFIALAGAVLLYHFSPVARTKEEQSDVTQALLP